MTKGEGRQKVSKKVPKAKHANFNYPTIRRKFLEGLKAKRCRIITRKGKKKEKTVGPWARKRVRCLVKPDLGVFGAALRNSPNQILYHKQHPGHAVTKKFFYQIHDVTLKKAAQGKRPNEVVFPAVKQRRQKNKKTNRDYRCARLKKRRLAKRNAELAAQGKPPKKVKVSRKKASQPKKKDGKVAVPAEKAAAKPAKTEKAPKPAKKAAAKPSPKK
eukprot:TRINITY_DN2849_c0_g1_i2.p1 TRINITY_DN2849_c0_g1~~TRINITY_DN2849_c0_g1_i2.p1  ORF type:complete len:216 (+),score=39.45 TRINITY_DN2849_c0_g1_i2:51-698(+)